MAFPHHGIAFEKDGLGEEGVAIDSVDKVFGFGAFGESATHNVEKSVVESGGMAPPSGGMWGCFGFEFPAWFVEGGFVFLNFHDLKYYMVGKLKRDVIVGELPS